MLSAESCHRSDCSRPVVTAFGEEALCLDHFCGRCYEFLHRLDRRTEWSSAAPALSAEEIRAVDECARRALDVSMSQAVLNNLERARLLDILLWCGDVAACGAAALARSSS